MSLPFAFEVRTISAIDMDGNPLSNPAEDAKLIAVNVDGTIAVAKADPFTWAWVAIALAEGALQWAGGQVMDQFFGDVFGPSRSERRIIEAIRAAVAELKEFIGAQLDEQVVDECGALCDRALANLADYYDVPEARHDRLTSAVMDSLEAVTRLSRIGRTAIGPYIHAASIRLMASQAEARTIGQPRAWRSVVRAARESVAFVEFHAKEIADKFSRRLSSVSSISSETHGGGEQATKVRDDPPDPRIRVRTEYFFHFEGRRYVSDEDRNKVERIRNELVGRLKKEKKLFNDEFLTPCAATVEIWKKTETLAQATASGSQAVDLAFEKVVAIT